MTARIRDVSVHRIAWATTFAVCLVTAVLLLVANYRGYAAVALTVAAAAAINLR